METTSAVCKYCHGTSKRTCPRCHIAYCNMQKCKLAHNRYCRSKKCKSTYTSTPSSVNDLTSSSSSLTQVSNLKADIELRKEYTRILGGSPDDMSQHLFTQEQSIQRYGYALAFWIKMGDLDSFPTDPLKISKSCICFDAIAMLKAIIHQWSESDQTKLYTLVNTILEKPLQPAPEEVRKLFFSDVPILSNDTLILSEDAQTKNKTMQTDGVSKSVANYVALSLLSVGTTIKVFRLGAYQFPRYGDLRQLDETNYPVGTNPTMDYMDDESVVATTMVGIVDGKEVTYRVPMLYWYPLDYLMKRISTYRSHGNSSPFPVTIVIDSVTGSPKWMQKLMQLVPAY